MSGTLSIPADATPITTRLRVVMKYTDAADNDGLAPTACGTFGYGETEDYTLTVTGGSSQVGADTTPQREQNLRRRRGQRPSPTTRRSS